MNINDRLVIDIDGKKNKVTSHTAWKERREEDSATRRIAAKFRQGKIVIKVSDIDMMYLDSDDSNNLIISTTMGYLITMQDSQESKRIFSLYINI